MPFVQAKCPECGGMLAVDDSKKAAMCQFCGEAFIVQEAVNNYITNNITNNNTNHNYGEGAIVNVYEETNRDFVIEGGVLKKYLGTSLTPVIPEGVVSIAPAVFRNCAITKVTFPSTLRNICSTYEVDRILGRIFYNGSFEHCGYLEEVVMNDGLSDIGSGAFSGCSSLKTVNIPSSVVRIGNEAFSNCRNLSQVDIPKNTIVGNDVFKGVAYYDGIRKKEEKALKLKQLKNASFETSEQLSSLGQSYINTDDAQTKEFGRKCLRVASVWQEYESTKKKYEECLCTDPALLAFRGPMVVIGLVTLLWGFIIWFLLMFFEFIIRKSKVRKIKKSDAYLSDMKILEHRKQKLDQAIALIRNRDFSSLDNYIDVLNKGMCLSCNLQKDRLRCIADDIEAKK